MAFSGRASLLVVSAVVAVGAGLVACAGDTRIENDSQCPNEVVVDGGACAPAGLTCNYAEPITCSPRFFTATCTGDGVWRLDRPCATGGTGGMGGSGNVGNDGGGGEGGTICDDPQPGAPHVTSELAVVFAPDRSTGTYTLTFDEAVVDVGPGFSWTGPGALGAVTKVGNTYTVRYSGLAPGDTATLTIDGVHDGCGNGMDEPVDVTITLLPSCHLFEEDFEGDFLNGGWSTADMSVDGLVWAANDTFDAPNGVPNHTDGTGLCASANDIDSAGGTSWDAELVSPPIDLTGLSNVLLRFQTDFVDAAGSGEAWLEASTDTSIWSTLSTYTDDKNGEVVVDLSDWTGGVVFLRWRYINDGGVGAWWDVDDVCVERFTKASCACVAGSITEQNDVDGVSDGNGSVFISEITGAVLTQVGHRVTVCGDLEHESISGPDFFRFVVGPGTGPLQARVTYCIENAFQNATSGVWLRSDPVALALTTEATNEGSYDVTLNDGLEHFVSVAAPTSPYTPSRYRVRVEVVGTSTPILSESFEAWPPLSFTITDDDPCANWLQSSGTVQPPGGFPTQGNSLAYFNSYECSTGSESLESAPLSFLGLSNIMLSIDMFHDPGFMSANDTIQVEYATSTTWIPIGTPLTRPGPAPAWETHLIDLSSLAGLAAVRIRLKATSAYGNHTHIDNVVILSN